MSNINQEILDKKLISDHFWWGTLNYTWMHCSICKKTQRNMPTTF